jgi:glutathione synthase/RimK-type ligase-like ATP-grasp enzyme
MYFYPYKGGSNSAKTLAEAMGAIVLKVDGTSKFKGNKDKIVINWGCSEVSEEVNKATVVNKPEAVALCTNKLSFFRHIDNWNEDCAVNHSVAIPAYTEEERQAFLWASKKFDVVARTKLSGHSGEGIVIYDYDDYHNLKAFPKAPLYTQYVKKTSEYRVHVMNGEVIDVVRKCRRKDVPDDQINWKIRNHANGFVFSRNEALGEVPQTVIHNSINAMRAVGLDFGAVDVIYNQKQNQAYVLEINTAPGLEGETVNIYRTNFDRFIMGILQNNQAKVDDRINPRVKKVQPPIRPWNVADIVVRTDQLDWEAALDNIQEGNEQ